MRGPRPVISGGRYALFSGTNPKIQALALATAGFALLSFGDAVVKTMAGLWPGTAIAALRYVFGMIGLSALLWWREGRGAFSVPDRLIHAGRGLSVALGACCFFVGIAFMPIAEATTITFLQPIFVALLSGWLLRERAPAAVWVAMALSFVGVAVIVRPNMASIGVIGLLPLATALLMACTVILNRKVAGRASALKMQWLITGMAVPALIGFTIVGHVSGIKVLAVGWPDWSVVARCALVAVSASLAHSLVYMATERASAATVAPTTYVQLLMATFTGWLFFNERPDAMTALGASLIVGGGLWLWRSPRA